MTDQAPEIRSEVTGWGEKLNYRQLVVFLILVVVLTFVGLLVRTEVGCFVFLSLTLFIVRFRLPPKLHHLSMVIWIIIAIALVAGVFIYRRLDTPAMIETISNNVLLRFLMGTTWSRVFWSATAGLLAGICLVWGPLLAVMHISSEWLLAMRETFGVTRRQALRLLISLVLNVNYPYYLIENGKMTKVKPEGVLDRLGGPGVAVIKPYNAVVFERAGKITRIEGPDMFMTKLFEFVKHIIDLRPQWESFPVEEVLTKDKVPLRIKCGLGYRIESRDQTAKREREEEEKRQKAKENHEVERRQEAKEHREVAGHQEVEDRQETKDRQEEEHQEAKERQEVAEWRRFPGIISGDYPVYKRTIFKAAYGPADDWKLTTRGATITQLRKVVAEFELRDIYRLDEQGEEPTSDKQGEELVPGKQVKEFALAEIGRRTKEAVVGIAHHWGVRVGTVNVDTVTVDTIEMSEAVREQVWKMWGAEYARRSALIEAEGKKGVAVTEAEAGKEAAYIEADMARIKAKAEAEALAIEARGKREAAVEEGRGEAAAKAEQFAQMVEALRRGGLTHEQITAILIQFCQVAGYEEYLRSLDMISPLIPGINRFMPFEFGRQKEGQTE